MEDSTKLTLRGISVIFANLVDDGFGRSITIDATSSDIQKAITEWVKKNNIGKDELAGKAKFKEYDGKKQYSFKLNDYTKFAGLNGLGKESLGWGATVSLTSQAFEYDNKFGKGTSASLSAVLIEKGARSGADDDLDELIGDKAEYVADPRTNEAVPAEPPHTDEDAPADLLDGQSEEFEI